MRLHLPLATIAAGILTIGINGHPTAAATAPAGFQGQGQSSVAGCPGIAWRLARSATGEITGISYYSDLSGTSMVKGQANAAGQFQMTLTSAMGNGPVGTVTGTRTPRGAVNATLVGQGCANMHVTMQPLTDINHWTNYGGGGH